MASPAVKVMALSNVYSRVMNFRYKGDIEEGHYHAFDHATLVSSGSVLVEVLNDDDTTRSSKEFKAPSMVYIRKDTRHRLTALEDYTVCSCIHALRNIDGDIIDPESFIEPMEARRLGVVDTALWHEDLHNKVAEKTGKEMYELMYIKSTRKQDEF